MPRSTQQAQPPLEFIPPQLNPLVLRLTQGLLPAIIRSRSAIAEIEAENVEQLVDLYQRFQAGKIRFLIAFRHPSVDDPLGIAYLLSRLVPQEARRRQVKLQEPVHAHFLYDRGIPLWAGSAVGWLYSRLGGIPVQRGKIDLQGLRAARNLFASGSFPMVAAPEGATNGHTEVISALEPGISQLGFWCVEDLQKAGRTEEVLILPIGIQYRYITPPWPALERLLTELEADTGLVNQRVSGDRTSETGLYQRLYGLGQHLLVMMEQFYHRFYHQPLPATPVAEQPMTNAEFADRLNALMNAALTVAEEYFGLKPKGSTIDRCRRLEQAGWDYIYREDLAPIEALPAVERGLADRIAEEADLRVWHMRLVESFVAVTGKYVLEKPSAERFAETALLMWDMVSRIKGNSPFARPKLGKQRTLLTIGQPISVSERWEGYKGNRRQAKQAVADLTQDLQNALAAMIR